MDKHELEKLLQAIDQQPTKAELTNIVREHGSAAFPNQIDLAGFERLMLSRSGYTSDRSTLRAAFDALDTNQDGFCSMDEVLEVLIGFGENATEEEVKAMLPDVRDHQRISFDE